MTSVHTNFKKFVKPMTLEVLKPKKFNHVINGHPLKSLGLSAIVRSLKRENKLTVPYEIAPGSYKISTSIGTNSSNPI